MKHVFVVTKPIQLLNALNIDCVGEKFFYVTPFAKRDSLVSNAQKAYPDIKFQKKSYKEICLIYIVIRQFQITKVYLDSDFGLLTRFILLLLFIPKYYLFEEGYASYYYLRKSKTTKDKIFLFIQKILRIKNYNGSGMHCGGIYIYDKDYYKRQLPDSRVKLLDFRLSYLDYIKKTPILNVYKAKMNLEFFQGKNVVVYLTSWTIEKKCMAVFNDSKYHDYVKALKPHPHIMSTAEIDNIKCDVIFSPEILFEYYLVNLMDYVNKMVVIHQHSFAMHYFEKAQNDKLKSIIID